MKTIQSTVTQRQRYRPVLMTRQDRMNPCRNCGHDEFVVIVRGARSSTASKVEPDVERCERCNMARHS